MAIKKIIFAGYEAKINSETARVEAFTYQGRELIETARYDLDFDAYWGDLLAPWPNRIADGKYSYRGQSYQLEQNEAARKNALHGIVKRVKWEVSEDSESSISLISTDPGVSGYPFELSYEVNFFVDEGGLTQRLLVTNKSGVTAPFGASIHPYFVAHPGGRVDEWFLQLPADQYMEVDPERLLPIGLKTVEGTPLDFQASKQINDLFIDHAFKVSSDATHPEDRVVRLISESGEGVAIYFDEASTWVQIHTADRDGGATSRRSLAIEPMSCPPDAFNSGVDLIEIEPGGSYEIGWRMASISKVIK